MEDLRKPFFLIALALILIVVLLEIGSAGILNGLLPSQPKIGACNPAVDPDCALPGDVQGQLDSLSVQDRARVSDLSNQPQPPGLAIRYMAMIDGIVLFTIGFMALSLFAPESITGRIQGCATCLVSFLIITGGIVLIFVALALLLLMIALLLSFPFGTIVYFAVYGFFNTGGARTILSLLMLLKIGFAVCLVLAQQRFLGIKALVLVVLTSLLANIIISFLHGFVPRFLVSITDAVGAIIVGILAVIWAIILAISGIFAILKALNPSV